MNAQTITVDRVTLSRAQIAGIFAAEIRANPVGRQAAEPAIVSAAHRRAGDFIRLACEQAAGMIPPLAAPAPRPQLALQIEVADALNALEKLSIGARYIPEGDDRCRGLAKLVEVGHAAEDEEGYFLTAEGRAFAEQVLG